MGKRKRKFISVLSVLILSLSCMTVQAASGIKTTVEQDKTEVKAGETLTLTMRLDDYQEIDKGVNAYKATLQYNRDVFEEVEQSDFQSLNDWERLRFNPKTGELVAIKRAGSKTAEAVMAVTLTAKKDIKAGVEEVTLQEIVTSEGKVDIKGGNASTQVDIIEKQDNPKDDPKDDTKKDDKSDINPSDTSKGDSKGDKPEKNEQKTSDKIQKAEATRTGDTTNWAFWFLLIVVESGLVILYIAKTSDKENKKLIDWRILKRNQKWTLLIVIGMISVQTIVTGISAAASYTAKGELNEDGVVDYKDVELLQQYLIHQGALSDQAIKNADMNSDGELTVTDLTLLIQKIEKTLDYTVELSDPGQESYYPEKNKDITLRIYGEVSYGAQIEKMTVDGREYEVKKGEDEVYNVSVGAVGQAGIKEFHFTEVVLNNGKRVPVNYTIAMDVLKDSPTIENYIVKEDIRKSTLTLSFDVKDEDKSMTSAQLGIKNEADELIQQEELSVGENKIVIPAEEGKKYKADFSIAYNRATDELPEHEEDYTGVLQVAKELELVIDYQWQIGNIATYKNGTPSTTFEEKEEIQIGFESSNAAGFEPEKAIVDGKEYPVTKVENRYMVTLAGVNKPGTMEVCLEAVVLSNGKRFEVKKDNRITLTICEQKPDSVNIKSMHTDGVYVEKGTEIPIHFQLETNKTEAVKRICVNNQECIAEKTGDDTYRVIYAVAKKSGIQKLEASRVLFTDGTEVLAQKEIQIEVLKEIPSIENYTVKEDVKKSTLTLSFDIKDEDKSVTSAQLEVTNGADEQIQKEELAVGENKIVIPAEEGKKYKADFTVNYNRSTDKMPGQKEDHTGVLQETKELELVIDYQWKIGNIATYKNGTPSTTFEKKEEIQIGFESSNAAGFEPEKAIVDGKEYPVTKIENRYMVTLPGLDKPGTTEVCLEAVILSNGKRFTVDKDNRVEITIREQEPVKVNIKSMKTDVVYVEKGADVPIEFQVETNKTETVERICVNNQDYIASKTGDDTYRVICVAAKKSGIQTLEATKVLFADGTEATVRQETQIEVLKDRPQIQNYTQEDKLGVGKVTLKFELTDSEQAFIEGKAVLKKAADGTSKEKKVEAGENAVTFSVEEDEEYTLEILATYDRDTNRMEGQESTVNRVTDEVLYTERVLLVGDYQLSVSKVSTCNGDKATAYFEKNDPLTIRFNSSNATEFEPEKATVSGKEYTVEKNTDGYQITLDGFDVAGIQEFTIEALTLNNGRTLAVTSDNKIAIEVLKTAPAIESYTVKEDIRKSTLTLSFDVKDEDKSVTSAQLEVKDEADKKIQKEELSEGENKIVISVEEGKKYKAYFTVNYNRSTDKMPGQKEDYTGVLEETKELELVIDYQWQIGNITTCKNGTPSAAFEKKEEIQIGFESSNAAGFEPEKAIVDGREYPVTKVENRYMVTLPGLDKPGKTAICLEEVVLSNGKRFAAEKDNRMEIIIREQKPEVSDMILTEDTDKGTLQADFNVTDPDKTLTSAYVVLLDENGQEIDRKEAVSGKNTLLLTTKLTGKYYVKVVASYQISGEAESKDVILREKEQQAEPRTNLKSMKADVAYAEKSTEIAIQFQIETNKPETVERIRVNNLECIAQKTADDNYRVTYKVSSQSGIQKLEATRVVFADGTEATVWQEIQMEVLKDRPQIQNYTQTDKLGESKVTLKFELSDSDQAFMEGKAVLKKAADGTSKEKKIEAGENTVTFSVEEDVEYSLEILATYDRDTNQLEGQEPSANRVTDEALYTERVVLVGDYQLSVSNAASYKGENAERYFEKNEPVTIRFNSSNATEFHPEKAVVDGREYAVELKDDGYQMQIDGFTTSGKKEITIEALVLNNGRKLAVTSDNKLAVEVLKAAPTVEDFTYTESGNDTIEVNFRLVDEEESLQTGQITITDDQQKTIKTQNIKKGENTLTFEKQSSESYYVKILGTYDRDSNALENGKNEYQNQLLKEEEIAVSGDRKIEMKDVLDVTVYRKNGDTVSEVSSIIPDYLNYEYYRSQYFVHVQMRDLPDFYANIRGSRIEDKICYLEIEYDNVTQYTPKGEQQNKLEVAYGEMDDEGEAISNSFAALMAQIKQNPTGTITLTRDYDATTYAGGDRTSLAGADFEFQGTINGNGHTIYNLNAPLFDELDGATIENLVFENVYINNKSASQVGEVATSKKAALANIVYSGTKIQNVHVKDMTIVTNAGATPYYGGIIGRAQGGRSTITIEECSVTNLKITPSGASGTAGSQIGGIVGLSQDTVIRNCYVEGIIKGNAAIGGIAGEINAGQDADMKNEIRNCITKAELSTYTGGGGGILGQGSSTVTLSDNISLSSGSKGNRIYGWGNIKLEGTNIAMSESALGENKGNKIETIAKTEFSKDTLKQLNYDDTIWNMKSCSYENLPALNNDDPRNTKEKEQAVTDAYIPDYAILKQRTDYDPEKEILYSNLYKLMPFYDSKYLVLDGKKIDKEHVLNKKKIQSIIAFDANKEVVTYLTEADYTKIQSIRLIFTDQSTQDYQVTGKYAGTENPGKMYGRIAMYKINELGIEYTYNRYIIKQDSALIRTLTEYIRNMDYDTDLNGLENLNVPAKRGYKVLKEHFNQKIRSEERAEELVLNLAGNVEGYSITQDNEVLDWVISKKVQNNVQFKKMMFAYNYYDRFYGVQMGQTSVSDLMLFKPEVYCQDVTFQNLIDDFWNADSKSTHILYAEFRDNLGPLLRVSSQGELIERAIKATTSYTDANEWFKEYFTGRNLLVELPAKDHVEDADYRAWTQIKKQPKYIMQLLTLPEHSAFIVSAPGTFLAGSQMVYITDPQDETQRQQLLAKMEKFGGQMSNFYNNVLGIIDVSYLNKYADIQIDNYNVKVYGTQANGKCTDPFHINFNDVLNEWFMANGASAYATDGVINYSYSALDNYSIWTHEIGHNQSYKLFFKGNGFRTAGGNNNGNLGGEDYTDGHTTQGFGDGEVNWNLSYDFTPDQLITTNLTQERINSVEKLDSYYKGMYEAIDFLDYAEAKAFLELTPQEQSKVAVQIQYPNANNHSAVTWKKLSAEEFEKMNLKTVDDLWKNQITIRPGISSSTTLYGDGQYGSEGMYIRRWYQPYNDSGRTHSWGFTYTTWQMLGIGGYENGYLTWFTGKSKNDLDAIQKITKDSSMTWEKFKKQRYKLMEDSMDTMAYLDSDSLVKEYVNALKTDAANQDNNVTASTNVRRINYHYLKRVTDDFRKEVLSGSEEVIHIASAEEFRTKLTQNPVGESTNCYMGSYVLDNDIDLSGLTTDGDAIINGYFMGKLDGNGHKLTGNTAPVFANIKFAHISNLTMENSNVQLAGRDERTGALANEVEYAVLENIVIRNVTVNANRETGALAGRMTGALVWDVHVTEAKVSGTARVGALAGYVDKSQLTECSANGETSATGSAVGGFAGEIVGGTFVKDSYSVGRAQGGNGSDDVGGFIGYVNGSRIENCYSNTRAEGRNGVAGFIGQSINNAYIKNNLTLANQFNGYKFDGRTGNALFTNFSGNYENGAAVGTSTLERRNIDYTGKIDVADGDTIKTEAFYTDTLGWKNTVWDFSTVVTGGIPKLRNHDPNDNTTASETYHISAAEDLIQNMNANPYARFVLDTDLDISGRTDLVTSEFYGVLDGNGHTITGNATPLFDRICQATIQNVILAGGQLQAGAAETESRIQAGADETGSLARTIVDTTIKNVHIVDVIIDGEGSRIGGMAGSLENTTVESSSCQVQISVNGDEVGGLAGRMTGSTVENSYTTGSVQGNHNVGGLVGTSTGSTIQFSYSAVSVNGISKTGGFVGQATDTSTIQNNIALGNQTNQYKFDGETTEEQLVNYANNFEYEGNRGISNLSRDDVNFTDKINVAQYAQITNPAFYTEILGWDAKIWDFSNIGKEETPILNNQDPKASQPIGVYRAEIGSVDTFIEELTAHPNGEFTLTEDMDFVGNEYNVGTVLIPGTFTGVIKGQGHTIYNLKNATLFEQFNGEVQDLNVDTFNYGAVYYTGEWSQYVSPGQSDRTQSEVAVFAKHSMKARYTNMKLDKLTIFGANHVAGLVAVDMYSTFENINIEHIYVNAGNNSSVGNQSALLVGEKTGGRIENCYVHGDMITEGIQCGGIVGITHGDVRINHVIANVYATNKNIKNAASMGLFVGEPDAATSITNSASIGMTASGKSSKAVGKFYGTATDISGIENCYENSTTEGTSKADGNRIQAVDMETLKSGTFYINTLGLDDSVWALDTIEERQYAESCNAYGAGPQDAPSMIFFGLR